jgi:hypothetical protein
MPPDIARVTPDVARGLRAIAIAGAPPRQRCATAPALRVWFAQRTQTLCAQVSGFSHFHEFTVFFQALMRRLPPPSAPPSLPTRTDASGVCCSFCAIAFRHALLFRRYFSLYR